MKKLIIKGMGRRYFSDKIVKWYLDNKRPLPWRTTRDPYRIWLSEIILQQTRVAQGLPYYHQFITHYPQIRSLANAPEQQVLRLWQGLGYYTRARNLHKCAKAVVQLYKGQFPDSYEKLLTLPGIGTYTAAAIASLAFDEAVAVVDGNVFRVLSRIFGLDTAINTPDGKKKFTALANELVSRHQPGLHNQAVMEFGALFCTPRNPRCAECPFIDECFAHQHGLVNELPQKIGRKKSRNRYFYYLVVQRNKSLLMKKRQSKDIWHGLFDFALVERNKPVKAEKLLREKGMDKWVDKNSEASVSKKYRHILTHQTIHCRFIHIKAGQGFQSPAEDLSFYTPRQVAELPKPALINRFLDDQKPR